MGKTSHTPLHAHPGIRPRPGSGALSGTRKGARPGLRTRLGLEIFRRLRRDVTARHELRTLFWECTLRCNLACRHCGSDCHADAGAGVEAAAGAATGTSAGPALKDMPVEDFLRVVDSLTPHVDPNKVLVIFTGGEALVRRDLERCGRALYDRGYPWGVVTNGMLLDRARLDSLLGAGLHSLTVSIDGFEADHNWMRGNPRSFERAAAALPMLAAEREIVWDVVTCANSRNIDTLEQFKEFLIDQGVARWRIFTVFPAGRALGDEQMQITDEQFRWLMEFIRRTRREGRIRCDYGCEGFLGRFEGEVRDGFFHCDAGISVASVLADGSISACPSIRADYRQGNIYRDDLWQVWNERFDPYRNREWMRRGECEGCAMLRYCGGGGMHLRDGEGNLTLCHYHRLG